MTTSYERLLEELYTSDKAKLEDLIESDARQILNDPNMRELLKGFIERLDPDRKFDPNAMKAVKYFETLSTISTLNDLQMRRDEVENFCSKLSDLTNVVDEQTLNKFLDDERKKTHQEVDDSREFNEFFKPYLRQKYEKYQKSSHRRRRHHHRH